MGGSFNPLSVILKENKLTGPNYIDWKRNLNLVLTAEGYKFVLTDVCPPKPDSHSSKEEVEAYQAWLKADEMARCYILASMSNVLQHQHESMVTAYDMMLNLKEMFGEQNHAGRQVAMKALLNTKMAEGTPVRDHVLKMIGHLNELEILGAEIDGESQVDIVLMSLPESFKSFHLNYSMNKEAIPWRNYLRNYRQQKESLARPRVYRLWRNVLLLLQRRVKKRERLLNKVQARSRNPRKVKKSQKANASLAVRKDTGKKIALRQRLVLKTDNPQLCL